MLGIIVTNTIGHMYSNIMLKELFK